VRNETRSEDTIAKRIIEGSLTFDSVEDFKNTLAIFPNNPGIHRAYGDMLAGTKSFASAAKAYRKACRLFVDQGMLLQAIVAKILEWRLVRPSHETARDFHAALRHIESEDLPLKQFFTQMTYPEMIAFMMKLVRVRLPARKPVKVLGAPEDHLYFVVSGALKETQYPAGKDNPSSSETKEVDLVENQIFGNTYPFDQSKRSESDVATVTISELVKISVERMREICKQHPNMEDRLKTLYEETEGSKNEDAGPTVRKATRHQLPTKARMKVFPESGTGSPLVFDGFTEDISGGGACFVLKDTYRSGPPAELVGANVKLEVNLPNAEEKLSILGNIVWGKEIAKGEDTQVALGLQFKEMDDHIRAKLNEYCSGSDGEQNLILSLWESYVKA